MAIWAADGTVQRRFRDVESEALQLIERLIGIAPAGSVAAVQIGNAPSWPAVLLALARTGTIPLPLGSHLGKAELEDVLSLSGARLIVRATSAGLEVTARDESPNRPIDAHFLKLTSGTTTTPRLIRFRWEQLVADAANVCDTMGLTTEDLNFGLIPMSHSYGFSNLITPLICRGVPMVASEERLPRAILDGLARTRATVFPGLPIFFQHLADLDRTPPLPSLRLCISAGAALDRNTAERFQNRFGLKIHAFYGSSECGGIAYDATRALAPTDGFVGSAMRGVSLTSLGEPGPIEVRSAAVGEGYFPEDDATVLGGGCFIPGDLVQSTADGLVLCGRLSDLINVAGRKLNPVEVEHRLSECPGVQQVVVFGIASERRGEEPIACVAGTGIDGATLARFCQTALSAWQRPRDFWLVPEIPVNERGKISRRLIAEQYQQTKVP